jgi:hypothetical protein
MSAPPGFDAGASMLPDNPSAQIHVMRGGGASIGGFTPEQTRTLSLYGLEAGGIIADEIDEPTKVAFLQQLESGACNTNSGDSAILKKDCWAVVAVIRALINYDIKKSSPVQTTVPPISEPYVSPDATPASPVVPKVPASPASLLSVVLFSCVF